MAIDSRVGPRFNVGDQITFVGPGINNGDQGEVIGVAQGFDSIYRYDVRFRDGSVCVRCFGFELQSCRGESKVA